MRRKQGIWRERSGILALVAAALATFLLTGCGETRHQPTAEQIESEERFSAEPASDSMPELAEARRVAMKLGGGLQKLLAEELARGGFAGAARVCSEQAQALTQELQGSPGSSARRVSLRYRNPQDEPDAYEARRLREWEDQRAEGVDLPEEAAELVRIAEGQRGLRYLKPIVVQPMCLSCHGKAEQIPAEVLQIVQARYPDDLATGYEAGDLRGAVTVVMPLAD